MGDEHPNADRGVQQPPVEHTEHVEEHTETRTETTDTQAAGEAGQTGTDEGVFSADEAPDQVKGADIPE